MPVGDKNKEKCQLSDTALMYHPIFRTDFKRTECMAISRKNWCFNLGTERFKTCLLYLRVRLFWISARLQWQSSCKCQNYNSAYPSLLLFPPLIITTKDCLVTVAIINPLMPTVTHPWTAENFWRAEALKISSLEPLNNHKQKTQFQRNVYLKVKKVANY